MVCESLSERVGAIVGPYGAVACPEFSVELPDADAALRFTMYPGFGRWNRDILESLFQRGALLKEAPDAIMSRAASDSEEPLVAIEFSAALPAGNQAWQRNGRAYSFIEPVRSRANADVIMACRFYESGKRCEIALIPSSPLGEEAANRIRRIDTGDYGVSIRGGK